MQFGLDKRGRKVPWGDVPARPFFPVTRDGRFYDDSARALVLETIRKYLEDKGEG
ncbi:hypothetical protein [Thiofaba sp. EF100]|uniref:hypothetical protein n=1 Tax=Thiofaba sp. EF100 TaxID=3121274 RepID=UPI003221FF9C